MKIWEGKPEGDLPIASNAKRFNPVRWKRFKGEKLFTIQILYVQVDEGNPFIYAIGIHSLRANSQEEAEEFLKKVCIDEAKKEEALIRSAHGSKTMGFQLQSMGSRELSQNEQLEIDSMNDDWIELID